MQEQTAYISTMIEGLEIRAANLIFARKQKELKQIAANPEKKSKETKGKEEETKSAAKQSDDDLGK